MNPFSGMIFLKGKPWKSMILIGGGVIAAEFAHFFSAFGTEVTIVEMLDRLVSTEEPEVSELLERNFRDRMKIYLNHKAIEVREEGNEKILPSKTKKQSGQENSEPKSCFYLQEDNQIRIF